jgi:hypothetical protein
MNAAHPRRVGLTNPSASLARYEFQPEGNGSRAEARQLARLFVGALLTGHAPVIVLDPEAFEQLYRFWVWKRALRRTVRHIDGRLAMAVDELRVSAL